MNELLLLYYPRVQRIVRLRLGVNLRKHLESGDICQETFIAAVHHFDHFEARSDSSLLHWLARIAENQIRSAYGYHHAMKRDTAADVSLQFARDAMESGEITYEPAAEQASPLDQLVASEDVQAVEAGLAELREDYREVLLLRHYVGAKWRDIADWMNVSQVKSVRMLHARAVTELARQVTK